MVGWFEMWIRYHFLWCCRAFFSIFSFVRTSAVHLCECDCRLFLCPNLLLLNFNFNFTRISIPMEWAKSRTNTQTQMYINTRCINVLIRLKSKAFCSCKFENRLCWSARHCAICACVCRNKHTRYIMYTYIYIFIFNQQITILTGTLFCIHNE